jgi:hypothetical protein
MEVLDTLKKQCKEPGGGLPTDFPEDKKIRSYVSSRRQQEKKSRQFLEKKQLM